MKKLLLAFLALSLAAAAQTISGVSLTGPPDNPTIVNNSGKTIIAVQATSQRANSVPLITATDFWSKNFASGTTDSLFGRSAHHEPPSAVLDANGEPVYENGVIKTWKAPIISTVLSGVIFDDGEIVGGDQDFQVMAEARLAAINKLGTMAIAGDWDGLSKLEDTWPYDAKFIMAERQKNGDAAAKTLGKKFQAMPVKLWRKP